jgi:glycosyltransferase involved in cell wall biosynthesis
VDGADVGELAAAISRLLGDEALRHRMSSDGRARVVRDFTWERAAAAVEAIHRRVAER